MTRPVRTAVIFANPEKDRALREIPRLTRWLKSHRIKLLPVGELKKAHVVITLGGDGTILAVAPRAAQAGVPVLGVNLGRLGFMAPVGWDRLYEALSDWRRDKWLVSERSMLEVQAPRSKERHLALNDAVIRLVSTTRLTAVAASIDGVRVGVFTGDGVIVSTTTGSTAYSLAAQGPIVHPDVEAIILTPICPHSFTQRPVVFPADQSLELQLEDRRQGNEVQLCLDGQRVFVLRPGDRVLVRVAHRRLKLLQDPKMPYFGVLREKLLWGGR